MWLKLKTLSVFSGTENFPARSLKGNWICWMMGFQIYCFRTGTFQDFSCFKRGFSGFLKIVFYNSLLWYQDHQRQ